LIPGEYVASFRNGDVLPNGIVYNSSVEVDISNYGSAAYNYYNGKCSADRLVISNEV